MGTLDTTNKKGHGESVNTRALPIYTQASCAPYLWSLPQPMMMMIPMQLWTTSIIVFNLDSSSSKPTTKMSFELVKNTAANRSSSSSSQNSCSGRQWCSKMLIATDYYVNGMTQTGLICITDAAERRPWSCILPPLLKAKTLYYYTPMM